MADGKVFTSKEIAEMQLQLKAAQGSLKIANDMMTAVATTLGRTGPVPPDPIQTDFNDNTIGSGDYQSQYFDASGNVVSGVSGVWNYQSKVGQFADDQHFTNTTGAYAQFKFTGTRVKVRSEKFPWHGIANVYIDGVLVGTFDQYNATPLLDQLLFDSGTIANGSHILKIECTGTRNAANTNGTNYIVLDKYTVSSTVVPPTPPAGLYDYYVGGSGASDSNNGTSISTPFATIGAAAAVATAGKKVVIRAGTYRETITPGNNGTSGNLITFMAYPGETVVVSGLDQMSAGGWTLHSGNIYKKTVTLPASGHTSTLTSNTSILANQVFRDGEMQFEATTRVLSTVDDLFDKRKWKALSTAAFQPTYINDSAINGLNLTGATINIQGWFATDSRTITSQSGSQANFSAYADNTSTGMQYRRWYTISNHLSLLTREKYWHYSSGTLYFWQQGGGSPTGTFEYKARNWGFNLSGKSYIKITGLNFKGCEICTGNDSTSNNVVDNNRATFTNHCVAQNVYRWQGVGMTRQMGTKLTGSNNVFINNELSYASTQGIWIGAGGRVENNYIHHIGYDGGWGSGVDLWGEDNVDFITVTGNTIAYTSRSSISLGYAFTEFTNLRCRGLNISYNNMSKWCLFSDDGGAIYTWGFRDHGAIGTSYQSTCHHNWFHDAGFVLNPLNLPQAGRLDGIAVALYLDQGAGPVYCHHNLYWNNCQDFTGDAADIYTQNQFSGSGGGSRNNGGCDMVNETVYSLAPWTQKQNNAPKDRWKNSILRRTINFYPTSMGSPDLTNTIYNNSPDPLFVGGSLTSPQEYFQLQSSSPAKDSGVVVPGITDGYIGTAPDKGAYELGGAKFIPGYTSVPYAP